MHVHVWDWKYITMKIQTLFVLIQLRFPMQANSVQAHWQHTRLEDPKLLSTVYIHHHVKVSEVKNILFMNYCISATACIVKYQININGELPSIPVTLKYAFIIFKCTVHLKNIKLH